MSENLSAKLSARGATSADAAVPNINVTPLIDVLLVLLIIFMVITPLRPARFRTTVPPPVDDPRVLPSPRSLTVAVERDLSIKLILGRDAVAEATVADAGAVAAWLAREWGERKARGSWKAELSERADLAPDERIERTVFIKAPRSIAYGEVAKVVDAVKGAGARPLGLQTDELPD